MKTTPPNEFRFRSTTSPFGSTDEDGMNGAFTVPIKNKGHRVTASCIVSDGSDPVNPIEWEHVSLYIEEYGKQRTPTWEEMCTIKNMFWDETETCIQYHPAKEDYVNMHPHVLHLWKFKGDEFPKPPKICI